MDKNKILQRFTEKLDSMTSEELLKSLKHYGVNSTYIPGKPGSVTFVNHDCEEMHYESFVKASKIVEMIDREVYNKYTFDLGGVA